MLNTCIRYHNSPAPVSTLRGEYSNVPIGLSSESTKVLRTAISPALLAGPLRTATAPASMAGGCARRFPRPVWPGSLALRRSRRRGLWAELRPLWHPLQGVLALLPARQALLEHLHVAISSTIELLIGQTGQMVWTGSIQYHGDMARDFCHADGQDA